MQNYGEVHAGDFLLEISIPRIDLEYNVVAGVSSDEL